MDMTIEQWFEKLAQQSGFSVEELHKIASQKPEQLAQIATRVAIPPPPGMTKTGALDDPVSKMFKGLIDQITAPKAVPPNQSGSPMDRGTLPNSSGAAPVAAPPSLGQAMAPAFDMPSRFDMPDVPPHPDLSQPLPGSAPLGQGGIGADFSQKPSAVGGGDEGKLGAILAGLSGIEAPPAPEQLPPPGAPPRPQQVDTQGQMAALAQLLAQVRGNAAPGLNRTVGG